MRQFRPPCCSPSPTSARARRAKVERLAAAFAPLRLLDVHSDPDHGRSVFTLAGAQGELARALAAGARAAAGGDRPPRPRRPPSARRRARRRARRLPRPGDARRGLRRGAHRGRADRRGAGAAGLPVRRSRHDRARERAELRARRPGGAGRADGSAASSRPTSGPPRCTRRAGAVLVTARPPLIAFNVDLDSDDLELAKAIAAELRESGGGPPGVRAIGLLLPDARARAGVAERARPPRRPAGASSSRACARARRSPRPSSSGWPRAPRSRVSRRTWRCAASTPRGT